ncbi:MAG: hypothetical protein M3Y43_12045 [Pseudomonadota bacterium]|nr:hypothetical protein [Pseudomonadota bacterium]
MGVNEQAKIFLEIERNQWLGGKLFPHVSPEITGILPLPGIGEAKLDRYGPAFLAVIAEHR